VLTPALLIICSGAVIAAFVAATVWACRQDAVAPPGRDIYDEGLDILGGSDG